MVVFRVMAMLRCCLIFAGCFYASSSPLFAQVQATRVELGAAFGSLGLDGIAGGIPPSAETIGSSVRAVVARRVRAVSLSGEFEVQWSGVGKGDRQAPSGTSRLEYRETRRDVISSLLLGIQVWEPRGIGSIHTVVGMSYVKPVVRAATRTTDAGGISPWTETSVDYHTTWAPTFGADLLLTFGKVSAGPTFRWYGYPQNVSPYSVGRPTRAILYGLTALYRF